MTTEDRGTVLNQVWRNHNPNQSKQVIGEKMNRFLYHKYGSSQIYYFTKELNDILTDVHSPASIISKDLIQFADVAFVKKEPRTVAEILQNSRIPW